MLRVFDVGGARFPGNFSVASVATVGIAGVQIIPLFGTSGRYTDFPLSIFDTDLLGEDIRWPEAGLYHKWDSIRHFKADGILYPVDRSTPDLPGNGGFDKYGNVFAGGANEYLRIFQRVGQTVRFMGDVKGSDYPYPNPSLAHQLMYADVYCPHGTHRFCVISFIITLHWYKGKLSFSSYRDMQISDIFITYNPMEWIEEDSSSVRRVVYSTKQFPTSAHRIRCEASLGQSLLSYVGSRAREMVDLYLDQCEVLSRPLLYLKPLRAIPVKPVMPDYEGIFAENRRNTNWRELASQAYQTLGMTDMNGIAYIKDFGEMGAAFSSFANTLRTLPKSKVKSAAQAWLSVHYGFKLALLDTIKLRDTLEKESLRNTRESKCQAVTSWRYEDIQFTARYQVFYNQYGQLLSEVGRLADLMDAEITAENLWDMVPYSFVIDWFVGIGDVLQSLGVYSDLVQKHTVIACGRSVTGHCQARPSQLGLPAGLIAQNIQLSCYLRRYSRQLQVPSLLPKVTVNPFNHLVEGAALVVSRR